MRQFLIASVLLFAASSAMAAQAAAPQGDAVKGEAAFERVGCWQCHGHEGQGGSTGPRIAGPMSMAWPAFQAWVRSTDREMPPYTAKVLPDQDLADIYVHLQRVKNAPDFKTIPLLNQLSAANP